jgi:hypothetical protein
MTSHYHDHSRGNADTAAGYLTAAGEGVRLRGYSMLADDSPVRQVAALQGIGWALLAACDQLADLADAVTGVQDQVGEVVAAVGDLSGSELPAEAAQILRAAAKGPGKSALMRRFLLDFFRRHHGAEIRVLDHNDTDADVRWPGEDYARQP